MKKPPWARCNMLAEYWYRFVPISRNSSAEVKVLFTLPSSLNH